MTYIEIAEDPKFSVKSHCWTSNV